MSFMCKKCDQPIWVNHQCKDDGYSDGTDEEVLAELEEMGIDVEKAKKSFLETIENAKAKRLLKLLFFGDAEDRARSGKG